MQYIMNMNAFPPSNLRQCCRCFMELFVRENLSFPTDPLYIQILRYFHSTQHCKSKRPPWEKSQRDFERRGPIDIIHMVNEDCMFEESFYAKISGTHQQHHIQKAKLSGDHQRNLTSCYQGHQLAKLLPFSQTMKTALKFMMNFYENCQPLSALIQFPFHHIS